MSPEISLHENEMCHKIEFIQFFCNFYLTENCFRISFVSLILHLHTLTARIFKINKHECVHIEEKVTVMSHN